MDLSTLIGLCAGFGLLFMAMVIGGGGVDAFVDMPSVAVVFGGAAAATLIAFPLAQVMGLGRVVKNAFTQVVRDPKRLIADLVRYAEVARRDGILALEDMTKEMTDEFIIRGIRMAVDGTDPEVIEQVLMGELDSMCDRHGRGKALFDCLGKYAPAFGMIGTLIGLVIMLQNMDDPSKIGPGMAVALITTLYGAIMSNLVFLPLADKLSFRSKEELLLREIVIKGVMSIQSGDNPRVVEQKLKAFLPPNLRDEERQGPGG